MPKQVLCCTASKTSVLFTDAEEPDLNIQKTADLFLVGHGAADAAGEAAEVGQISAAVAAAGTLGSVWNQSLS